MLCGETVAVYCENRTEHINTVCGHFSSYLTGDTFVSAREPNRLMLFGETVAVYCENRAEHINTLCGHFSWYLTGNTVRVAAVKSRRHFDQLQQTYKLNVVGYSEVT
jgi:translation initiation factor IF-1